MESVEPERARVRLRVSAGSSAAASARARARAPRVVRGARWRRAPKLAYETQASAAAVAAVEAPMAQGMEAPLPRPERASRRRPRRRGRGAARARGCYGALRRVAACVGVDPGCVRGTCGQHDCGDDCAFFPFAFLACRSPCIRASSARANAASTAAARGWCATTAARRARWWRQRPGAGCYMAPCAATATATSIDESATPACACRKKC